MIDTRSQPTNRLLVASIAGFFRIFARVLHNHAHLATTPPETARRQAHPAPVDTLAGMIAPLLVITVLSLLTPPPATWEWPVRHSPQVVRDFDAPRSQWGPGHRGLDLLAPAGTPVVAPVSGRIHFSGDVAGRGVITIRTASDELVSMEPVQVLEAVSSRVRAGERIGRVASGHCPRGCLHIGLRVDGDYRSPARELGILRRAQLVAYPAG